MVLEWKKPIEFGVSELDAAHKQLFDWVVRVDEPTGDTVESLLTQEFLQGLNTLFLSLFPAEDALMSQLEYGQHEEHCEDHADLLVGIKEVINRVECLGFDAIQKASDFIIFTIAGHVETMDRPLAHFVSKERERSPLPHRRTGDSGGLRSKGRRTPHSAGAASGSVSSSEGGQPSLRSLILDTYTQALLVAKLERGLSGEAARSAACLITANAVTKLSGRKITKDMVAQIILSR